MQKEKLMNGSNNLTDLGLNKKCFTGFSESSRFQNTPETTIQSRPEIIPGKISQAIDVTPPGVILPQGRISSGETEYMEN